MARDAINNLQKAKPMTDEERKELALLIGDGESDVKPVM